MGTEIHWLAIVAAGIAAFMVGAVWYSVLFGKAWMAARGVTKEQVEAAGVNPAMMFGTTLLLELAMAFVLDHVLGTYGDPSLWVTLMIAGGLALGFVIPAMAVNYVYLQTSLRHFLIDAGHWLAVFLVMGGIFYLLA